MMNEKGFGKFEVLTIIVLLLAIFAYLMYSLLGGASKQKINAMKDSAVTFGKTVAGDTNSFPNPDNIYLDEAIENGLMNKIKSPVRRGYCDGSESKFTMINGSVHVTLKCGDYIINEAPIENKADIKVYKVGNWTTNKPSGNNIQEKILYNCTENGKNVFDEYLDEFYFVYKTNDKYSASNYNASDVSECNAVSKTFYRTMVEYN